MNFYCIPCIYYIKEDDEYECALSDDCEKDYFGSFSCKERECYEHDEVDTYNEED